MWIKRPRTNPNPLIQGKGNLEIACIEQTPKRVNLLPARIKLDPARSATILEPQ